MSWNDFIPEAALSTPMKDRPDDEMILLPQKRQALIKWLNLYASEILGAFSYSDTVNGSAANKIFFSSDGILFQNGSSGACTEAKWSDIRSVSMHDEWIRIEFGGGRLSGMKGGFLLIAFRNDKRAIANVLERILLDR